MKTPYPFFVLSAVAALMLLSTTDTQAQPNLEPYEPPGWSDKIVVSTTTNSTTESSPIYTTNSLYVAWGIINAGNQAATNTFLVSLYVDGVSNNSWAISGLGAGYYTYLVGYPIGELSAGSHTVEIIADPTHVVTGDNESDNSYTKTISVTAVDFPAPTPITPANASISQSVVPYFSWSPVANATVYRLLIASNPSDLPSSPTATNGGSSVVVDAVCVNTNFVPSITLSPNATYYWEVNASVTNGYDGTWSSVESFTSGNGGSGITIIPSFDGSITSDPNAATIEATINAAIAQYKFYFTDPITVTITFVEMGSGLGLNDTYNQDENYSSYLTALTNHATSTDDATALAHLPGGPNNPVNGNSEVYLQLPLARALGYSDASPPEGQPDSILSLNTSIMNLSANTTDPRKYSLFSTVCHETDEVLGISSALSGLENGASSPTGPVAPGDLFRYDQSGNRSFTTSLSATAYFSLDGTTDLAQFNQFDGGDFNDWYSYDVTVVPQVQDAFLYPGVNPYLGVELRVLDVLGYTRATTTVSNAAPQLANVAVSGGNCQFNVLGTSGGTYVVQYSSNLLSWVAFATNVMPTNGVVSITNAIGANTQRYFRAVTP